MLRLRKEGTGRNFELKIILNVYYALNFWRWIHSNHYGSCFYRFLISMAFPLTYNFGCNRGISIYFFLFLSTMWGVYLSIFKEIPLDYGYLQFQCSVFFRKSDFQHPLSKHVLYKEAFSTTNIHAHDYCFLLSMHCSGFPWRNAGYLPVFHLHTEVSKAFINLQIFIVGSLYLKNFLNVSGHKRNA